MKKTFTISIMLLLAAGLSACGGKQAPQTGADIPFAMDSVESTEKSENAPDISTQPSNNLEGSKAPSDNVLIAYFSRVGNTDFPDGVDAISSASLLMKDNRIYGNTQYLATLIQRATGGRLFSIQVSDKYPSDYDSTVDRAEQENRDNERPELETHVDHIEDYEIIYLGFSNWWYDMPMAVYSFLDEYDLSGKTIVPFCTSGGSAFSNSIEEIQLLEPEASVLTAGFAVTHSKIENCTLEDVEEWIKGLDLPLQE